MKSQRKRILYAKYFSAYLSLFIISLLVLSSFLIIKQDNSEGLKKIKKVYYETKTFGISQAVDEASIPDEKFAEIRPYSQTVTDIFKLDQNYLATRTREYDKPAFNPDKWIKPYFKSVTNANGTSLYARDGSLIHFQTPSSNALESSDFSMTDIDLLGFYPKLEMLTNAQITELYQLGFTVSILSQNEYVFYNDTLEMRVDVLNQSYDKRIYSQHEITRREFRDFNQTADRYNIPEVFIDEEFEVMGHGLFRESIKKEFLEYVIDDHNLKVNTSALNLLPIEQGKELKLKDRLAMTKFSQENEMVHFQVKPNPAKDFLVVNTNKIPNDQMSINIVSMQGQLLKTMAHIADAKYFKIDIQDLTPGAYLINFISQGQTHTTTFIKR